MGNNKLLFSVCWTLIIDFGPYSNSIKCVLLRKEGYVYALNGI
jgi:hypothetical protein